ncbi:MAG: hypothetical protein WA705_25290 [Candidatus Ozemobacteraceae bacterium]
MKCEEFREQMLDLPSGPGLPQEPDCAAHLAECPECSILFSRERIVSEVFHTMAEMRPPASLAKRILKIPELATAEKQVPFWHKFFWGTGFSVALASLIFFAVPNHRPPLEDRQSSNPVLTKSSSSQRQIAAPSIPPVSEMRLAMAKTSDESPPGEGSKPMMLAMVPREVPSPSSPGLPSVLTEKAKAPEETSQPVQPEKEAARVRDNKKNDESSKSPRNPPTIHAESLLSDDPSLPPMTFARAAPSKAMSMGVLQAAPSAEAPAAAGPVSAPTGNALHGSSDGSSGGNAYFMESNVSSSDKDRGDSIMTSLRRSSADIPGSKSELSTEGESDTSSLEAKKSKSVESLREEQPDNSAGSPSAKESNVLRKARLKALLKKFPQDIKEGPLDLNQWVLNGRLSVKERIALAPPPGFQWAIYFQGETWKIALEVLVPR